MRDQKKAEAIAAERMQMLAPLLAEGLDPAKASQLKTQICSQTGLSGRTLRRYLAQYRAGGFDALKPKGKGRPSEEAIPIQVLDQAILLRREVPSRSVAQIIQILEWEEFVQPGQIKRSTLTGQAYPARLQHPTHAAVCLLWHCLKTFGAEIPKPTLAFRFEVWPLSSHR